MMSLASSEMGGLAGKVTGLLTILKEWISNTAVSHGRNRCLEVGHTACRFPLDSGAKKEDSRLRIRI